MSGSLRRLGTIRDAWLARAQDVLAADPSVVGVALVGSLGRGDHDDWSDVDLLVAVGEDAVADFADPRHNPLLAEAVLTLDAPHNAPLGATSLGALYVEGGLPFLVDWYVYPVSMAAWPNDARVLLDRGVCRDVDVGFAELVASGTRQPVPPLTPSRERRFELMMTLIAAKQRARGRLHAQPLPELPPSDDPELSRAIARYLSIADAELRG